MKLTGHVKHLGMHTTHTTHSCRHEEIYYLPVSPTKFLDSHVDFPSTLSFQLLSKGICFLHHCCIELLRVGSSDYSGTSMRATTSVVGIKLKNMSIMSYFVQASVLYARGKGCARERKARGRNRERAAWSDHWQYSNFLRTCAIPVPQVQSFSLLQSSSADTLLHCLLLLPR